MKSFKVNISVLGRFHGFDLARELQRRGHLNCLISSYPFFAAKKFKIQRSCYQSHLEWEFLARGLRKIKPLFGSSWDENFFIADGFDKSVSKKMSGNADIFVGWSGVSLHSLRVAKKFGMKTILERGSAHIEVQHQILAEEYARQGLKFNEMHPKIIEKEVLEYQEADFISIPSTFVRRSFVEKGIPESKLIQIPYGVSLDQFSHEKNKHPNKFRIIYCGTASLQKGVFYLLEACNNLNIADIELWFVGHVKQEIKPFLKKYQHLNITLKGKVSQDKLKHFYSQCSIFCLPSLQEGLAMVIPQAMACGLPILCTENTGGRNIIRDGKDGFIVPIRDVKQLAEKILFFYENPHKRIQMGRNAAERVSGCFSWMHYGEKMIEAYERVLGA